MDQKLEMRRSYRRARFVDDDDGDFRKKLKSVVSNSDEERDEDEDEHELDDSGFNTKAKRKHFKSEDSDDDEQDMKNDGEEENENQGMFVRGSKIEGEEFIKEYDYTEDGIKIIPFNMKEELEEGTIDDVGNYIANTDKFAVYDKWLEGITKEETEKARIAVQKAEEIRARKEFEHDLSKSITPNQALLGILRILKQKESVAKAMRRLSSENNSTKKWVPKWKAKRLEKKKPREDEKVFTSGNTTNCDGLRTTENSLNTLVALSNRLADLGEYGSLDLTYEQIVRKLRLAEVLPETWMPMDPIPNFQ